MLLDLITNEKKSICPKEDLPELIASRQPEVFAYHGCRQYRPVYKPDKGGTVMKAIRRFFHIIIWGVLVAGVVLLIAFADNKHSENRL